MSDAYPKDSLCRGGHQSGDASVNAGAELGGYFPAVPMAGNAR